MNLPFTAFLATPPIEHGFSDAFSIKIVRVIEIDEHGRVAKCVHRCGSKYLVTWELFDHLSSTKTNTMRGIEGLLDDLFAKAPNAQTVADAIPSANALLPGMAAPKVNHVGV
jgi:hypothetical protein